MDPIAAIKIIGILTEAVKLGEKLTPVLKRITALTHDFEDPNRPDVTLEAFDAELAAMRARSAEIQQGG